MEDNNEIQQVESRFNDISSLVADIGAEIQHQEHYESAILVIEQAKEIKSRWVNLFEPIRSGLVETLNKTYERINKVKKPCEEFIKILTPQCVQWELKKEAEAKALEQKLQAETKKQFEEVALNQAQSLADQGRTDVADAILSTPIPTVPIIHAAADLRTSQPGSKLDRKGTWKAEVYDLPALIKAVLENHPAVPKNALEPNMSVLDKLAKAMQKELNIPGVRAIEEFNYAKRKQ